MLDKQNFKPQELEERLESEGRKLFYKDAGDGDDGIPRLEDGVSPLEDLSERMKAFRAFILDLAVPRLKEMFRVRAAVYKHGFPDVHSLEDYILLYRTGTYGNEMRGLVHYLSNQLWGTECMGHLEKIIMDKAKLKYKNTLVNGDKVKTRRTHGSIKKMLVRFKQTMFVDRFR